MAEKKRKHKVLESTGTDADIQRISEEAYRNSGIAESNRQQGIQNGRRVQQQREEKKQRSSGVELLQNASNILKNSPTAFQTPGYQMNTGDYAQKVLDSRAEQQKKPKTSFWEELLKDRSKDAEKSKMPDMRPIGSVIADAKPGEAATRAGEVMPSALKSTLSGVTNTLGFLLDPSENSGGVQMRDPSGSRKNLGEGKIAGRVNEVRGRLSDKLYDTAKNLSDEAAAHEEAAKDGLGKVGQTLIDVGIAGVQMAGDASLGMMTGSGMLPIGARVFGQSAREGLDAGASRGAAAAYAAGSAAVEMLTEKMFDVAKIFGGGAADDLIEKAVEKWSKTPAGARAIRTFFGVLTESGEEAASDLVNPIVRLFIDSDAVKETYGTEAGRHQLRSDIGHDALIGGILGGGGTVVNGNPAAERQQRLREAAAEAARAEQRQRAAEVQRELYASNTMQTGTADAEAAAALERNRVRANRPQTAQALSRLTNDALINYAESSYPLPLNQLGLDAETQQALREAGLTYVNENSDTPYETLHDHVVFDERSRRRTESRTAAKAENTQTGTAASATSNGGSAATHIDNRGADEIRKTSVKAFQYEHPELREHFQNIARQLQQDAAESVSNGPMALRKGGTRIQKSKGLAVLMERTGLSRNKLVTVLQNIIDDHGAENNADAKRVELALDYLMSQHPDYRDEAYREKKGNLEGGTPVGSYEEYLNDNWLAIEDGLVTEEQVRQEWEQMQAERNAAAEAAPAQPRSDAEVMREAAGIRTFEDVENAANAEQREVSPEESTGAAPAGFGITPENAAFEEWSQNAEDLHPMGEDPRARGVDLPTENPQGEKTMRGGRTVMEAAATPEYHAEQIGQLYVDGHFSYVPVNNTTLAAQAEATIEREGWEQALQNWTAQVQRGDSNADLVAMGAVLLNNIGNAQQASTAQYLNLLSDYIELTHRTGQALQANRILKRLTPQARLYMMQRAVNDLNEAQQNSRRGRRSERRRARELERQVEAISRQRDDALNLIREIGDAFREEQQNNQNPSEALTWQQRLAAELERHVLDSQNAANPRPTPIGTIMTRDLFRFADDIIERPDGRPRERRTALDRLADYFMNREEYDRAWDEAQAAAMEVFGEDPDAMERLQAYLNGSVMESGGVPGRTALSAVAEAVAQEEMTRRDVAMRAQYGDVDGVTSQILQRIQQTVPINTVMDYHQVINAINHYVRDTITQRNARGELVNGDKMLPEIRRQMHDFGIRMSEIIREGAETKEQVANRIAEEMVNRFGVSMTGAQDFANNVVEAFNDEVADRSERALNNMFRERERSEPRNFGERLRELSNLGAFSNPNYAVLATRRLTGDNSLNISMNEDLAREFLEARTDAERDEAITEIQRDLARQLPTSWMEKWNALRYVNMLGNFKTQGRNIMGNTTMGLTAKAKREALAAMEHIASAVTGGRYERMTSFVYSPELYAAARQDFRNVQKAALGEAKFNDANMVGKSEFMRGVQNEKRIFNSRVLEAYRKATNWAMETGDVIFSRATYADALAGYMKAHNLTAEDLAPDENGNYSNVVERGRLYAIKEAQEATFRDNNTVSDWVSQVGRGRNTPRAIRVLAEGVLPFRKTPANVLVRAEEYSPLGAVNSLVQTFRARNPQSDVTAQDALDSWAKTVTGSAILYAGWALAKAGLLHGKDDDDKDQSSFDSLTGHQEYALEIGGKSYTLDAFTPTAMPMLVGGALYELTEEGGLNPKGIEAALSSLADPMINMSMLSGVNDAFNNVQNAENNLGQLALNSALGYLTQGLTNTMLGQVERTLEPNRMTTYTESESPLPNWLQKALGKASAKTPILDYHQTEYLDNWGRTQSNGTVGERIWNNFFSPWYTSQISDDRVDKELARLNEATGDTKIYPSSIYNLPQFSFDGEQKKLTQAQKEAYQKEYGQTAQREIRSLLDSDMYSELTNAEKNAAIKAILSFASNEGKDRVGADVSDLSWVENGTGDTAQDAAVYALLQAAKNTLPKDEQGKVAPKLAAVYGRDLDEDTLDMVLDQFLDEKQKTKVQTAQENGYSIDEIAEFWGAMNDFKRKKSDTINWATENGYSQAQASYLYKLFIG